MSQVFINHQNFIFPFLQSSGNIKPVVIFIRTYAFKTVTGCPCLCIGFVWEQTGYIFPIYLYGYNIAGKHS